MSRRSHHRSQKGGRSGQPGPPVERATTQPGTAAGDPPGRHAAASASTGAPAAAALGHIAAQPVESGPSGPPFGGTTMVPPGNRRRPPNGHPPGGDADASAPADASAGTVSPGGAAGAQPTNSGCTAPQLRRFIKSRSWVPMHELRRRFAINGPDDDVTAVTVNGLTIYVGLPPREGRLLGELLQAGDIGYELSLDPATPVVIGVYPMRPVPRH